MPGMMYLVSVALLVALIAWMVRVYNHLAHLREVVCHCWAQWRKATQQRNACLADYTAVFAMLVPQGDPLPRELRRMREDSERSVSLAPEPRWCKVHGFVGGAEFLLRQAVERSMHVAEESPVMRAHESFQRLCSNMAGSLYQQEQVANRFNQAVRDYNAALASPSARFLGPVFGFSVADTLEAEQKNTRSTS